MNKYRLEKAKCRLWAEGIIERELKRARDQAWRDSLAAQGFKPCVHCGLVLLIEAKVCTFCLTTQPTTKDGDA